MKKITSLLAGFAALASLVLPGFAFAQAYYPYTQLQVVTQTQAGVPLPASAATVTVFAPNASLSGIANGSQSVSWVSNFQNDSHIVTFTPGSYSVSVAPISGYTFSYSPGCQGTAYTGQGLLSCTITASNNNTGVNPGQLLLYTQVNSYSSFGGVLPSNFFLTVSGNSPSPSTVQISNSSNGASVALQPGFFSVNAPAIPGWQVSQQGDCQGTIQSGQSLTCRINYSFGGSNNYGYPYGQQLSCLPSFSQVAQGQNAEFTAVGGTGVYNWATAERNYPGTGAVLNTLLLGSGMQTVVVSSGSQTATCMVDVLPAGSTISTGVQKGNPIYSAPNLPNTGFAPHAAGAVAAIALVLVLAITAVVAPYVRRAFDLF